MYQPTGMIVPYSHAHTINLAYGIKVDSGDEWFDLGTVWKQDKPQAQPLTAAALADALTEAVAHYRRAARYDHVLDDTERWEVEQDAHNAPAEQPAQIPDAEFTMPLMAKITGDTITFTLTVATRPGAPEVTRQIVVTDPHVAEALRSTAYRHHAADQQHRRRQHAQQLKRILQSAPDGDTASPDDAAAPAPERPEAAQLDVLWLPERADQTTPFAFVLSGADLPSDVVANQAYALDDFARRCGAEAILITPFKIEV